MLGPSTVLRLVSTTTRSLLPKVTRAPVRLPLPFSSYPLDAAAPVVDVLERGELDSGERKTEREGGFPKGNFGTGLVSPPYFFYTCILFTTSLCIIKETEKKKSQSIENCSCHAVLFFFGLRRMRPS